MASNARFAEVALLAGDLARTAMLQSLMDGRALTAARRHQHQHALGAPVVGQVLDHGQGRRIGPVEVLEHQQAAAPAGQGPQQPQHGLRQHQQRVVTRRIDRPPPLRQQPAERGSEGV